MISKLQKHREEQLAKKAIRESKSLDPRTIRNTSADLTSGKDHSIAVTRTESGDLKFTPVESTSGNVELRMYNHLNTLSSIKSIQERIAKKAEWIGGYAGYIEGCLAESPAPQNTTLVTLMIWAVDVGDFDLALRIAKYAVLNEMAMPEGYKREIAEFVTEGCCDVFIQNEELAVKNVDVIEKIIDLGDGENMVDEVRAKSYRALGNAYKSARPSDALTAYTNALRFSQNAGCKKDLNQLEKQLNRQTNGSPPDANVSSPEVSDSSENSQESTGELATDQKA